MLRKLTGLGMLGVLFYVAHVVLGGILWQGYSHLQQPISDLTASGAPQRDLLSVFTWIYGVLCIAFALVAYLYTRRRVPKLTSAGLLVFLAMHLVSISYGFFPQDLPGAAVTFVGTMHMVVTAAIVPLTILSPLLIGFGLRRVDGLRRFAAYSIVTGFFIFVAGGTTGLFFANHWPFFGLVERINIGALQVWTFALSWMLFRGDRLPQAR